MNIEAWSKEDHEKFDIELKKKEECLSYNE